MVSTKVILTGSFGVGKTSLFQKFIFNKFSERYLTTIGVRVDKKVVEIDGQKLNILLWDIAGEVSQNKVPHAYLLGTSGIIYVFDLSRPLTVANLKTDIEYLQSKVPGVTIKIVGNKKDLVTDEQIAALAEQLPVPYDIVTSAKTGENVDELFEMLGRGILGLDK